MEGFDLRSERASISVAGKMEVPALVDVQRTNSSSPDCSQITMVFIADFNSDTATGEWVSDGYVIRSRCCWCCDGEDEKLR